MNVALEQLQVKQKIKANGLSAAFRRFQQPKEMSSVFAFLEQWALIGISVYIAQSISLWLIPVLLILIGSRQRALSNLVHDSAHKNLFKNRQTNDIVANLFAALPMFETVGYYRKNHFDHHNYLGTERDPDLQSHLRYGYDDVRPQQSVEKKMQYLHLVTNWSSFKDSVYGSIFKLNLKDVLSVLAFWLTFSTFILLNTNKEFLFSFLLLWFGSRITTYHCIRIFAEFLDHTGLKVGSIHSFTRNIPSAGYLRHIIHPCSDNYHLVHHLFPQIPHYNLAEAHKAIKSMDVYKNVHHCTGYFSGNHAAVLCWTGGCKGESL